MPKNERILAGVRAAQAGRESAVAISWIESYFSFQMHEKPELRTGKAFDALVVNGAQTRVLHACVEKKTFGQNKIAWHKNREPILITGQQLSTIAKKQNRK